MLCLQKNSHFGKLHVYLEIQVESHFLPPPEKMEPADYCQNWEHLLKLGLWDRAWGAGRYCLNDLIKWTSTSLNVYMGKNNKNGGPFDILGDLHLPRNISTEFSFSTLQGSKLK